MTSGAGDETTIDLNRDRARTLLRPWRPSTVLRRLRHLDLRHSGP